MFKKIIMLAALAVYTESHAQCVLAANATVSGENTIYSYSLQCKGTTPDSQNPGSLGMMIAQDFAQPAGLVSLSSFKYTTGRMNLSVTGSPASFWIAVSSSVTVTKMNTYYIAVPPAPGAPAPSLDTCVTTPDTAGCYQGQVPVPDETVNSGADSAVSPASFKALVGVGSQISGSNVVNYSLNSNILSAQGPGRSTPQILVGGSFQLFDPDSRSWECGNPLKPYKAKDNKDNKAKSNCRAPYLPTSVFVNLKLAPSSESVLNGYTFGAGFALKKDVLDLLVGYSLSPDNEPSLGFRKTASIAVKNNPALYPTFNADDIAADRPGALDGFSTLQNTSGAPLFPGNVLTTHYRGGLFVGLGMPLNIFKMFAH